MPRFDATATLHLLQLVESNPSSDQLDVLLSLPDLQSMLRAFRLSKEKIIPWLRAVKGASVIGSQDETGRFVKDYFGELLRHREEIQALAVQLGEQCSAILEDAFTSTRAYLPNGSSMGDVRLVLLPLAYDCRTDRETIYMDPLSSLTYGTDGIRGTLAHELHHVARYRITREDLTLMRPDARPAPQDVPATLREWAAWMESEGVADCVSNMGQFDHPFLREAVRARRDQERNYTSILTRIFEGLPPCNRPVTPGELVQLRETLKELAHPVGHALAAEIEQTLGRKVLVDCVGRSKRFLERFNEVASKRDGHIIDLGVFGLESQPDQLQ
ncbi:MAG: DUF5700 domain-containing putative Zn-dependent protease [Thermoplasmata archaeon]